MSSRAAQTARDLSVANRVTQKSITPWPTECASHNAKAIERLRGPSARFASLGMTGFFYRASSSSSVHRFTCARYAPPVSDFSSGQWESIYSR
ncbi:MAG: hypothetical protein QOJ87_2134 [Verrucomicrobiota bacterium]